MRSKPGAPARFALPLLESRRRLSDYQANFQDRTLFRGSQIIFWPPETRARLSTLCRVFIDASTLLSPLMDIVDEPEPFRARFFAAKWRLQASIWLKCFRPLASEGFKDEHPELAAVVRQATACFRSMCANTASIGELRLSCKGLRSQPDQGCSGKPLRLPRLERER
jgi:hypothetical protein